MKKRAERVTLIVLDSVGCVDAPDAVDYGDTGSNTIGNISRVVGGLNLPNLCKLGLGQTTEILGVPPVENASGAFSRLTEWALAKTPPPATGN
jgi:phosphopentomutase